MMTIILRRMTDGTILIHMSPTLHLHLHLHLHHVNPTKIIEDHMIASWLDLPTEYQAQIEPSF